jgi:hypothetical protein
MFHVVSRLPDEGREGSEMDEGPFNDREMEVDILLSLVPELTERHRSLVRDGDGEPGAAAVFGDLADVICGAALRGPRRPQTSKGPNGTVLRCLAAIEVVAERSLDADELVGWSFLDNLRPDITTWLRPWLGPRTTRILEQLDEG